MGIIRQEYKFFTVPDFRHLGVAVRIFASAIILMLVLPLFGGCTDYNQKFVELTIWMSPATLITVLVLFFFNRPIHRLPFSPLWVWLVVAAVFWWSEHWFNRGEPLLLTHFLAVTIYTFALMHYQFLIDKAYSPALAQAQLSALTARIRPHFLFNSLNAAIGLVRNRPRDAETVLENLADLFRAQLKTDNQESSLGKEIELAQGYIAIETIRLGEERLRTDWQINAPLNACVPRLFLQPLLENAVYHGIEPSYRPGCIEISVNRRGAWIYVRIDNPLPEKKSDSELLPLTADGEDPHRKGNQMALNNLSERLFLMFDHDATLSGGVEGNIYRLDIRLPYYPYSLKKNKKTFFSI